MDLIFSVIFVVFLAFSSFVNSSETSRNSVVAAAVAAEQEHVIKTGQIFLQDEGKIAIEVSLGKSKMLGTLATGNTYTQIGKDIAISMGLKGHPKLIGFSSLADNSVKIDFLAKGNITVADEVQVPLVLKVGPNCQPVLLGLDLMISTNMTLDLNSRLFTVQDPPVFNSLSSQFRFIDLIEVMRKLGITDDDLVDFSTLGDPQLVYAQAIMQGEGNNCIYLEHRRWSVDQMGMGSLQDSVSSISKQE